LNHLTVPDWRSDIADSTVLELLSGVGVSGL
jgi:hypothetical protein